MLENYDTSRRDDKDKKVETRLMEKGKEYIKNKHQKYFQQQEDELKDRTPHINSNCMRILETEESQKFNGRGYLNMNVYDRLL